MRYEEEEAAAPRELGGRLRNALVAREFGGCRAFGASAWRAGGACPCEIARVVELHLAQTATTTFPYLTGGGTWDGRPMGGRPGGDATVEKMESGDALFVDGGGCVVQGRVGGTVEGQDRRGGGRGVRTQPETRPVYSYPNG